MRSTYAKLAAIILTAAPAAAYSQTAPIVVELVPATRPAFAPATAETRNTLLVLPFYPAAGRGYEWMGAAIQQDLMADLNRMSTLQVEAPASAPPAADSAAAIQAARSSGAVLVLYGQYQAVNGRMRITGQLLDVNSGKAIGGLSATGSVNDVFPLEDQVAEQATHALPREYRAANAAVQQTEVAPQPATEQRAPTQPTSQGPYFSYTYPADSQVTTYSYRGGAPYYAYAYPYYGPDVYFYGGIWGPWWGPFGGPFFHGPGRFGHFPGGRPGFAGGPRGGGPRGGGPGGGGGHGGGHR